MSNPKRAENLSKERGRRAGKMAAKQATFNVNKKERAKRTHVQQLAALDFRLGQGVGAERERKVLAERIAK